MRGQIPIDAVDYIKNVLFKDTGNSQIWAHHNPKPPGQGRTHCNNILAYEKRDFKNCYKEVDRYQKPKISYTETATTIA